MSSLIRNDWTADELDGIEKACAAASAAGELLIAQMYGLKGCTAMIYPTLHPVWGDLKTWTYLVYLPGLSRLSKKKRMMVLCAGYAADLALRGYTEDTVDLQSDLCWSDSLPMGYWEMVGCVPAEPSPKLVQCAFALLKLFDRKTGPLWQPLRENLRRIVTEFDDCAPKRSVATMIELHVEGARNTYTY